MGRGKEWPMMQIPSEIDRAFRLKSITDSERSRSLVPRKPIAVSDEADHRFRLKPIGVSTKS